MVGRTRMRRRLPVVAAAAVVAASAVAGLPRLLGDDAADLRSGSVEEGGPAVDVGARTPRTYRIDYRVVGLGGGVVVTSERLFVRRPFESRLEGFDAATPPEGEEPATVQVADLGRLLTDGANSSPAILTRPPGPGASDVRLEEVVEDALDAGLLEQRERRRVAGRPCQVFRSGSLLTTGVLAAPTDREHADTCIDEAGLVLEELLVVAGDPLLRRVALEVEEDVELDDELFSTGSQTVPLDRGGGAIVEVTPDSRTPGTFWELRADAPSGLRRQGRYIVVAPQAEDPNDPQAGQRRLTYVSDVFVDGTDLVLVEQGSRVDGSAPFDVPDGAHGVELGALGAGSVLLGANGSSVVVRLDEGRFVRVSGTVGVERLAAVAGRLSEVGGGDLTPVGPPRPTAG